MKPSGSSTTPPRPWIGSTKQRGDRLVDRRLERLDRRGDVLDAAGQRLERLGMWLARERERAHVRPWKPSTSATTRERAPPELLSRASLKAASFASAPSCRTTRGRAPPAPASRVRRSASSRAGSVVK
jgi:hypothetical protein